MTRFWRPKIQRVVLRVGSVRSGRNVAQQGGDEVLPVDAAGGLESFHRFMPIRNLTIQSLRPGDVLVPVKKRMPKFSNITIINSSRAAAQAWRCQSS